MPLERTGVELVAEGATSYLGLIGAAEDATNSFIKSLQALAAEGDAMQNAFSNISPAIRSTGDEFGETDIQANNLFGTLVGANFVASIVTAAFYKIINSLTGLARTAISVVSVHQELEVSLESLIAREYVYAGAADTVTQAMDMVGHAAKDVLMQLDRLSDTSPFSYQQIVAAFEMNMVFGQSSEMAFKLTKAMIDMAAVKNQIPGVLQRVTYMFGRMAQTGRIAGQELRYLMMLGVDMAQIMKDELGMSLDEVNKQLATGAMNMDDVSEAFIRFIEINFSGAAERASRTIEGLARTFADTMEFIYGDITRPVIDRITVVAGDLLDAFREFADSGVLRWIGAGLDIVAESAVNFAKSLFQARQQLVRIGYEGEAIVEKVDAPFVQLLKNTASTAIEWAEKAFVWGANLMAEFSSGIIEGAASTLSAAMDFVSGMLSWFMSPGSPPRISPEVDAWGTAMMTEFLQGFQRADFNILGSLNTVFKSLFSTILEGADAPKAILGFSKEIAAIMATGEISTDFYDRLKASSGEYGDELAKLVEMQLELAGAAKKAEENQKALAAAQEAFQKASDSASALVSEYNRLLESGADKETLKAKRAQVKAALEQRKEAKKTYIETAKTAHEDQKANSELEEKVRLQQQLLSQLIEYAKLQKEAGKEARTGIDRAARDAKAAAARAGAGKAPAIDLPKKEYAVPGFGGIAKQAEETFEYMKDTIREKFSTLFAPFTTVYEERIKPAFLKIQTSWNTLTLNISTAWKKYVQPVIDWLKELIPQETYDSILRVVGQVIGFRTVLVILTAAVVGAAAIIKGVLLGALALLTSPLFIVIALITALKLAWDHNFLGMRDILTAVWNFIQPIFAGIFDWLKVNIPAAITAVVEFWNNQLLPALKNFWKWVQDNLFPLFESIGNFLSAVWTLAITAAKGAWESLQKVLDKFWKETLVPFYETSLKPLLEILGEALTPVIEVLKEVWEDLTAAAKELWKNVFVPFYNDILLPLWNTFLDITNVVKDATKQFNDWATAIGKLKLPDWLTPGSPTPLQRGLQGLLGVISKDGILGRLRELGESFGGIFESAGEFYKLITEQLGVAIETLAYRFGTILNGAMTRISTTIRSDLLLAFSSLSTLLTATVVPAVNTMSTSLSTAATSSTSLSTSWGSMKASAEALTVSIQTVTANLDALVTNIQTSHNAALSSHQVILVRIQTAWEAIAREIKKALDYLIAYNIENKKTTPPPHTPMSLNLPETAAAAMSLASSPVATPARSFSTASAGQSVQNITYQYVLNASVPTPIATVEHGFKILQVMGGAG
jgi:tape measure domain-containing protein